MAFVEAAMIGGSLLGLFGASQQASAQQQAAQQQLQAAREAQKQREKERQEALQYAGPSASELEIQSNAIDMQRRILGDAQKQLDFLQSGIDILNPGASQLGKGMYAAALERTLGKQYQSMMMQLGERGITAASTAGQGAMARFGEAAANASLAAQGQLQQQAYGAMDFTSRMENLIKSRQVNAALASPVSTLMAQNVPYAGASQVGAAQMGGMFSQFGANLSNLGIQQMQFGQMKDLYKDMFGQKGGVESGVGIGGSGGYSYRQPAFPVPSTVTPLGIENYAMQRSELLPGQSVFGK